MKVLVDYDNVPVAIRRVGVSYVVDRVRAKLAGFISAECNRLEFRLYGGWDQNSTLTAVAQRLTAEIGRTFPRIVGAEGCVTKRLRVDVSLVHALEKAPNKLLRHTHRKTTFSKQLMCLRPTTVACRNTDCQIDQIAEFLNHQRCPEPGCAVTPVMLLSTLEQKLVDTAIVADLIHLSLSGHETITLVSSDDDLWPGIISSLLNGSRLIHVHTTGSNTARLYRDPSFGRYFEVTI